MLCESWEPRIWFDFACCTLDNRTSLHRYTRLSPLFFAVTLAAVTVVPSLIALDEHMHCLLKLASLDYVLQRVCWVNTRTPVLASFEGNLQTTRKLSASACVWFAICIALGNPLRVLVVIQLQADVISPAVSQSLFSPLKQRHPDSSNSTARPSQF